MIVQTATFMPPSIESGMFARLFPTLQLPRLRKLGQQLQVLFRLVGVRQHLVHILDCAEGEGTAEGLFSYSMIPTLTMLIQSRLLMRSGRCGFRLDHAACLCDRSLSGEGYHPVEETLPA